MQIWELETERLCLRQWKESDFPLFAALNADPVVMEHFPKQLQPAESDAIAMCMWRFYENCVF